LNLSIEASTLNLDDINVLYPFMIFLLFIISWF